MDRWGPLISSFVYTIHLQLKHTNDIEQSTRIISWNTRYGGDLKFSMLIVICVQSEHKNRKYWRGVYPIDFIQRANRFPLLMVYRTTFVYFMDSIRY